MHKRPIAYQVLRHGVPVTLEALRSEPPATHAITTTTRDTVEFGEPVTLYRAECACGWRSCWHTAEDVAGCTWERHVAANREAR